MLGPIFSLAPCPCGSGTAYGVCCGPLRDGNPAPTAEALMRSRNPAHEDETGVVECRARFRDARDEQAMRETSRFERRGGRWVLG